MLGNQQGPLAASQAAHSRNVDYPHKAIAGLQGQTIHRRGRIVAGRARPHQHKTRLDAAACIPPKPFLGTGTGADKGLIHRSLAVSTVFLFALLSNVPTNGLFESGIRHGTDPQLREVRRGSRPTQLSAQRRTGCLPSLHRPAQTIDHRQPAADSGGPDQDGCTAGGDRCSAATCRCFSMVLAVPLPAALADRD